MATSDEVFNFFHSINPGPAIIKAGDIIAEAASKDPQIAKTLTDIHKKITRQFLRGESLKLYERIHGISGFSKILGVPEEFGLLLAVLYLKAKFGLERMDAAKLSGKLKAALKKGLPETKILDPDFLGELMVETAIRAARDNSFAQSLKTAANEIKAAVPSFQRQKGRVSQMVDIDCEICKHDENGAPYDCITIPDWVCWGTIIIIIIVIVIIIVG